ncbi:MAG: glycosyltransferase family 4 protein [Candidatus Nanoarchaeia archaeon]|nr:glycosyltransferase family 4 protein [Candidatus Nanoarchaeia archaeon]
MNKLKVISISSVSASLFLNSGRGDIKKITQENWHGIVAKEMKNKYPSLEIECWSPEKKYKNEEIFEDSEIKFRIFPSNFVVRPGMELCFPMIKALNKEIKEAERKNIKLIIHIHEYHSWQMYLILLLLKKTKNTKVIVQHHGGRHPFGNLLKYKRLLLFLPVIMLMQFFENLLFKKINVFYALGDKEIEYLKRKAPESKIRFQTMGIDEKYFKIINKNYARKTLGLELNKKYLLYIGRIKTTKGIKELLDGMKGIDAELLLIGDGPDRNKFEHYSTKEDIKNIKFLGSIYDDKKLDYLSACDCLILPSHTEGAPVVLMEAVAKNLPVIATDVGGVKNMIENGREGIVIKPKSKEDIKNSINEILGWKKKNIQKYAEKYKWKQIVKETLRDYENDKKDP